MKVHLPVREAILNRRTYEVPAEGRSEKLRLDFNENTAGCSPAVRRALAKLTTKQLAMYPEYQAPTRRIARYFGVRTEALLLTNGGDDALRRRPSVLFIANPNNPTGTLLQKEELRRILKAATHTAVVMDEAYAEFSGFTAMPWIWKYPQLFVARTFSKVAGLAALRLGAVIACEQSLALVRRAMPPFPVNLAALVAAEAALKDSSTMRRYILQVQRLRPWFGMELEQL